MRLVRMMKKIISRLTMREVCFGVWDDQEKQAIYIYQDAYGQFWDAYYPFRPWGIRVKHEFRQYTDAI